MISFSDEKVLPYTAQQLYDLVADIESYPTFLPWCKKATYRQVSASEAISDLTVGPGIFRKTFTSRVWMEPPHRIEATCLSGPLSHLLTVWHFKPYSETSEASQSACHLSFHIELDFESSPTKNALGSVFTEAAHHMIKAFEDRAAFLYKNLP